MKKAKKKDRRQSGGWQNADCEFTQLDFSDVASTSYQSESNLNIPEEHCLEEIRKVPDKNQGNSSNLLDLDVPHPCATLRPNHYLCTLLPSRKAYAADSNLRTYLRKKSSKSNTMSHTMTARTPAKIIGGVRYEAEEDESDFKCDNLSTPDEYWEKLLSIKTMPVPISVKREYRNRLKNSAAVANITKAKTWKGYLKQRRQKMSDFKDHFVRNFDLWRNPLKIIEGTYGTGIVSYFVFIRWLLMLNFLMFFLIFTFILLPSIIFGKIPLLPLSGNNQTVSELASSEAIEFSPEWYTSYKNASINYERYVTDSIQVSAKARIQDFLQGTGWMELTYMFYGHFTPNNLMLGYFDGETHWYLLPLSYLIVTGVYFFICMMMMVHNMIIGSKENLVIHEAQFYRYFNLTFGSWDFCITDANSAALKKMSIYVDMQSNLKEDEISGRIEQRSAVMKTWIILVRTMLNVISIFILVGAGYLIYYVTITSFELYHNHSQEFSKIVLLLLEFLTPLTITALNLILPGLFKTLVKFEYYRPDFAISITLFRSVFVRLASLGVLMSTFSRQISCDGEEDSRCIKLLCWETYVGQQLYKLVIVDFFVVLTITFLVETPRRILVTFFPNLKLFKLIGKPEFDIAKHVLDLIYGQTLCWLGVFYCPMLPAIGVIKCMIFFYVKKFTLLHNCKPTMHAYKASRSNTFFMAVLFMAFLLSCIPLVYSLIYYTPSKGCGPFSLNDSILEEVFNNVHHWPDILRNFLNFICTAGFAIPFFIILCLLMYYYYILSSAYKELALVIKEQLKDEGRDKQYLLSRLTQQT